MNYKEIEINNFENWKVAKSKAYKSKELKELQISIKSASNFEKINIGKKISELKMEMKNYFDYKLIEIKEIDIKEKMKNSYVDITFPVNKNVGGSHPLTIVSNRFRDWFIRNGYFESVGSEVESTEFNFDRLNLPEDHPARGMQDSIFINKNTLMRTHNTGFTSRELLENQNTTFSHFVIGKVYRNDEDDATHSHQFQQVDLVSVGENISIKNLIWTLKSVLSYVLEEKVEIRMRPSYFPFTEPSMEVDVFYKNKWIEILGSGILNNKVLEFAGYDTDRFSAFAAGIGVERVTMIKYGISNIREFYKNDKRFLDQFKGGK
ncbi:MAG: phenylalanine--tRNA ligase subunit alpha [Mollicutes bacterium PWAP]|nr:phenylalanine--tRNA ligase subunit alpha [Mollicutes bacterium PWAP]